MNEKGEEEHFHNVDSEELNGDVVGKATSVTSLNSTQSDAASSIFGVDSDDDNDNDARWKSVNRYGFTGKKSTKIRNKLVNYYSNLYLICTICRIINII